MVLRRGAFRRGAHGDAGLRQQEDRGGAWCAGSDNAALAAEASLGCRHGVAQYWATTWCGGWCVRHVFLTCFVSHLSACDLCLSSVGPQHLTVQNKRRRLEWCSSMLERLGETKRLWEVPHKTRRFKGHCSLCSIPRFKRSFLFGFLWFFAESLAAFFLVVLVIWRFQPRKICTMFLLLLSCSRPITHGDDALASRRQLRNAAPRRRLVGRVPFPAARAAQPSAHEDLLGSATSRNCLGTCLSRNLRHVHSIATQNVESGFRHIFEHSSACGNMVIFSRVPLSSSVSLPRIWLSRSTSKIDALDDDETPLRLTASQTDTTGGVMISGIMGAGDIAPRSHFVEPG